MLPLATFSMVMSITPGPNNFMLLASGARFGLRRSLPHLLGVTGGFLLLLVIAYAGVAAAMLAWPAVTMALTVLCAAYLLWLGAKLLREAPAAAPSEPAHAREASRGPGFARPLRWTESALFQFVNPKGWGMAVAAVAMLADGVDPQATRFESLVVLLAVSGGVNLPCVLAWTLFGAAMRRLLERPAVSRAFNLSMAVLVAATAAWMLLPVLRLARA